MGSGQRRRTWYKKKLRRERWNAVKPWLIGAGVALLIVGSISLAGGQRASQQELLEAARNEPAPTRSAKPPAPVAAFIGDSFSAGAGTSVKSKRWTTLLAKDQGWAEKNFALGGTGYLNTAGKEGCGKELCENYLGVVDEVIEAAPDIVVVSGGVNDRWHVGKQEFPETVEQVLAKLAKGLPDAELIVTSPVWNNTAEPAEMVQVRQTVKAAAEDTGFRYLDIGQPFEGKRELLAEDGFHPANEGHAVLAQAVASKLD